MSTTTTTSLAPENKSAGWYIKYLLIISGLGGLLYGIDVGIIAGALPHLEATSGLNKQDLSYVVAAVLGGSVLSSFTAGFFSDLIGRRWMMVISGALFALSIPIIAMASGENFFFNLMAGRILQGISGGLIGVVVPLYLAECLPASIRGKGTGFFQLLLTFGLVAAAFIGLWCTQHVEAVELTPGITPEAVLDARDTAWRLIFWYSIIPGILFTIGAIPLAESPRWLFRRGKVDAAKAALTRARKTENEVSTEMHEMADNLAKEKSTTSVGGTQFATRDSLLSRKYLLPFIIAVIILACNQATGVNSILAYIVNILDQAGLSGELANKGDVAIKIINCVMTVLAVILVDKMGRKFLLSLGSAGIIISLGCAGFLFKGAESKLVDVTPAVSTMIKSDQLNFTFDEATYKTLAPQGNLAATQQIILSFQLGDKADIQSRRLTIKEVDGKKVITAAKSFEIKGETPDGKPLPLKLVSARLGEIPSEQTGWMVSACLIGFMSFFAIGPGVCVWLALSELMPTRIRANGMSIALFVNQFVSTAIAATFLPIVGNYGYSSMFLFWAGCTVVYFVTAFFFLPETKNKTLEEIEEHFSGKKAKA